MASANASRDHGVLFARAYLDSKLAELKEDQQTYLVETLKEWLDKTDNSSLKAHVASFVGPVLDVLGHIRSELEGNSLTLYSDRSRQKAVSLCYVADPHEILDQTSKGRNYAVSLIIALRKIGLKWGILTNGLLWRLYCVKEKAPFETYFQVDLGEALRTRDSKETFLLAEFFGATAFLPSETGRCRLDTNRHESDEETKEIERHLESKMESILGKICMGFIESEGKKSYAEDEKRTVFSNSIYLLYRILFILYAEARGLLPLQNQEYYEKSIEKLMSIAKENHCKGITDPHSREMWNSLCELFDWINRGNHALLIPPYNGGLFDDGEKPYLANHVIHDAHLSEALFSLGFREEHGKAARTDYNDLSVRPLGSLYEGILEYQLFIAPERMIRRKEKNVYRFIPETLAGKVTRTDIVIEKGDIYFSQSSEERKLTGSYYTPEDVVQYIVENSLGQHLADVSKELRALVNTHAEAHTTAIDDKERRRVEKYTDAELVSFIENRVLSIKVLDPAMGSGHFLVNAAHFLSNFIVESLYSTEWENDSVDTNLLSWRRRVVEKCIFGVDLNDLATELAKLSLWLITADKNKPLTFLDHHLRTGNSLFGTDFSDLGTLPGSGKTYRSRNVQMTLNYPIFEKEFIPKVLQVFGEMEVSSEKIEDVEKKKGKFREWEELKEGLQTVADVWLATLFRYKIGEKDYQSFLTNAMSGKEIVIDEVKKIANSPKNRFFHWWLEFPEVFFANAKNVENEGFDVVIGNPPYVRQEELLPIKPYLQAHFTVFHRTADLFVYFFERGFEILKEGGYYGIVVSNKWLKAGYGKGLREFIGDYWIEQFIDFGDLKVFEDATTYPCIIINRKTKRQNPEIKVCQVTTLRFDSLDKYVEQNQFTMGQNLLDINGWNFSKQEVSKLLGKLESDNTTLREYVDNEVYYGIKTGFNEAYVIDEQKRNELIATDPKSEEIIKPFVSGEEIRRYGIDSKNQHIILAKIGIDLSRYRAIQERFLSYKQKLEKRTDQGEKWYELRTCTYYDIFTKPKITFSEVQVSPKFTLDEKGFYANKTVFSIPRRDGALVALLNSKLFWFLVKNYCNRVQGGYILSWKYLGRVPVPRSLPTALNELANRMLQLNEKVIPLRDRQTDERTRLEEQIKKTDSEIDELVYEAYGITEDEKRIIENAPK